MAGAGVAENSRLQYPDGGPIAGDVVVFASNNSFVNRRIVGYQELIGFTPPASLQVHIGIMFDDDLVMGATTPKSKLLSLNTHYQGRIKTYLRPKKKYIGVNCGLTPLKWALSRCNLKYGWWSLGGFYIALVTPFWAGNPLANNRNPYCSFLIAWSFRRSGFDPCPGIASSMVTPAHLFESDFFEVIR